MFSSFTLDDADRMPVHLFHSRCTCLTNSRLLRVAVPTKQHTTTDCKGIYLGYSYDLRLRGICCGPVTRVGITGGLGRFDPYFMYSIPLFCHLC